MQPMLDWDDLRIFLAVHRQGAHGAAARALGVDPTTVGRRLGALEAALGVRLFVRTRAGLAATDEGARLYAHAERVEAEVVASERELGDARSALEGTVRLTAGDGIISYVLVPALGELLARHPALCVELRGEYRTVDLSRREADIALRFARPKAGALVSRRLGLARFGLFASESYLLRRGRPTREEALAEHDLIAYETGLDETAPMVWLRRRARGRLRIRSSTTAAMVAACVAGQGIAIAIEAAMRNQPGIVHVLPRADIPSRDVWGVVHADLRRHPRVVAVLAWAAAALAAAGMR
jgi:DNA-binding transcriptional LysR family regulator